MKKKIMTALAAIMLSATLASAAPSVNGSTGMINNPSADVLREGQLSLGYYRLDKDNVGVFNTNLLGNMEVGVAGFRCDGDANKVRVNAKFRLASETILTPGIAVGIEDIAGQQQRSLYAVASKSLPFGFRIHAGTGGGRFDGVFAGIEKTFNPLGVLTGNNTFPATTLLAEFDGKTMNYGARLSIVPGLKVDAGWRDHASYFGISFTK